MYGPPIHSFCKYLSCFVGMNESRHPKMDFSWHTHTIVYQIHPSPHPSCFGQTFLMSKDVTNNRLWVSSISLFFLTHIIVLLFACMFCFVSLTHNTWVGIYSNIYCRIQYLFIRTNREAALSDHGMEQVKEACGRFETEKIVPTVVRYSLAANAVDTANIVGRDLKVSSLHHPSFSFKHA
jgi:hypothetical protein